MDRQIVYPGAIPLDTDILSIQRNTMVALGFLAQATLGKGTIADGLACTQTTPASMSVQVGPGSLLALSTVDATAFGSLAADTTDPLVKVGVNLTTTTLALTAPGTSGQSINYLIQAAFQESDATPVVLPYYNSANPAVPYSGPSNSGASQNTRRLQRVVISAKAGTPATTGTQTTPAADAGYTGLYVVTVAYGASTVTNSNISVVATAPFIPYKLGPGMCPGFSRTQFFGSSGTFYVPAGVTRVEVEVWGGGSGSAYGAGGHASGGGGGGGYSRRIINGLTPGAAITVTVGAGGAGGNSTTLPTAGGTSSFGGYCSATGGQINAATTLSDGTARTAGGSGSGGDINLSGGWSEPAAATVNGAGEIGGNGGNGARGGAGGGGNTSSGSDGTFPGGGGGGSGAGINGRAGAAGWVVVRY